MGVTVTPCPARGHCQAPEPGQDLGDAPAGSGDTRCARDVAVPPRAGTHPVSSMIQPSHESGHRQSPGRRGEDRAGGAHCAAASLVAPRRVPTVPTAPREAGTCGRAVLVPHHAHVLPQGLRQCHRHGRHVAVLRGSDAVSPREPPALAPARPRGALPAPTSLTPPARAGEQMPPTKAVPLRLL